MDFVRSNFGTNEPLPVEHFFPHFLAGFAVCSSVQLAEVHLYRSLTFYKIHTLRSPLWNYPSFIYSWFVEPLFLLHSHPKTWSFTTTKKYTFKSNLEVFCANATMYKNTNVVFIKKAHDFLEKIFLEKKSVKV